MNTRIRFDWKRFLMVMVAAAMILSLPLISTGANGPANEPTNAYERLMQDDGFVYGVVVPWTDGNTYANDIGAGQLPWNNTTAFNPMRWREIFTNCKAIGFNCVRIWLFEQAEGIVFDADGDVTGIQTTFLDNLKTVLDLAAELGVNLDVTLQAHLSFSMYSYSAEAYQKYSRMTFDPAVRQHYLDRVVTPVCTLLDGYKDRLVAVDVFAEPEGDVSGRLGNQYQPYGTTWDNMADHVRAVAAKVRELLPDVAITASSGWQGFESLRRGNYNDLGLDIIGIDIYNDYGDVHYDTGNHKTYSSLKDLRLTKPAWVAEFGVITSSNWSDFFQTQTTIGMYESARAAGYTGAFYWMYGYPESGESLTLVGRDGNLRPVVGGIKMMISQNHKDRVGDTSTLDTPTMLYGKDVLNIRWLGSRNTDHYKLERSTDKTAWTLIADDIDPVVVDPGTYICSYQDQTAIPKIEYFYRVTAYDSDGNSKTSGPSNGFVMKKLFCTPEENALQNIGFETGSLAPYVVYGADPGPTTFGITTTDVHEGSNALYIHGTGGWAIGAYQSVTLKPNTEYTFTMWAKATSSGADNSAWNMLTGAWSHIGAVKHFIYDGQWHYYTMDFLTSSDTTYLWYFGDGGGDFVFDDMYLFEK